MTDRIDIISGMVPGGSGVGRVAQFLLDERVKLRRVGIPIRMFFRRGGIAFSPHLKNGHLLLATQNALHIIRNEIPFYCRRVKPNASTAAVLIHPQSLGFKWVENFIEKSQNRAWIYLMDASYFCIKSYNYISGESSACTRCIKGHFENAQKFGCTPFPRPDPDALRFVQRLMDFVREGRVGFLVQNPLQGAMVREHYGSGVKVREIGLWAADWDLSPCSAVQTSCDGFDVVFHGAVVEAKGLNWALQLAAALPGYRFLFPVSPLDVPQPVSPNCTFRSMAWETGLKEAIAASSLTLVPSLWSAPIEGALVKSIATAKLVGIVENPTAYSAEIGQEVLLRLPFEIEAAARKVGAYLEGREVLFPATEEFLGAFEGKNHQLMKSLIDAVIGG